MALLENRPLGRSGVVVSELGLGTNNFGTRLDESQSQAVVVAAIESGVTFFDTADTYGAGTSEQFLGRALRPYRNQVVIATKVGHPQDGNELRQGASRRWILEAVDESLRRLQTDWIDLYQVHMPDPRTPIAETLAALGDLLQAGKIRMFGTSNFAAWELIDADWTAQEQHWPRPVSAQYVWNLLERELESNLLPAIRHLGIGLIAARPLAYGFLTGKFADGSDAVGARLPASKRAADIMTATNFSQLAKLTRFAADRGHSILELSFAYLLSEPILSSVIVSASTEQQLNQNLRAGGWRLTPEERAALSSLLPAVPRGQPAS